MIDPYRTLRALLFRLDAERTHNIAQRALALASRSPRALRMLAKRCCYRDRALEQTVWGLTFPNPVGLAAGFDKNATLALVWEHLGFGFAELGTLTPRPQAGNPRPRLFRLPDDQALINRMGFNNDGAVRAAARLRSNLVGSRQIPLGLNVGKNKDTPLEHAADDYNAALGELREFADYVVVNVSSPNTPGLRELQLKDALDALLGAVMVEHDQRPLLLKVSPDITLTELDAIIDAVQRHGVNGIIATNTTVGRSGLKTTDATLTGQSGGLSGRPLRETATQLVREIATRTGGTLPIIGVGGIFTGDDAYERIRAGASLVQLYTGFIYGGPATAGAICRRLHERLNQDGFSNVSEASGADLR